MFPLIWFILLFAVQVCPEMSNSSECVHQSESLTYECKELLVRKSTNCTLITCAPNHTNKSTRAVSLKCITKTAKECVSRIFNKINETLTNLNETQEAKHLVCFEQKFFLSTENVTNSSESQNTSWSTFTSILEKVLKDRMLFLTFLGTGVLIGMLLSSIIACFVIKCHRKKSRNLDEGLEVVTTETFSKKEEDEIQDFQDDGIQDQEAAEGGAESDGQLAAETNESTKQNMYSSVNDTDMTPKETVYSNIDFSAMKERNPTDVEKKQDATETEYAEIKKGETKERLDNNEDESEMLDGSDEKEVIIEEDKKAKQNLLAEEVMGEDVPLYSRVDEIMEN